MTMKSLLGGDSFASRKKPITVKANGYDVKLFVEELGYLQLSELAARSRSEGLAYTALLISESVSDVDGNRFTYDEAIALRKDIGSPIFDAVAEVNLLNGDNSKN